MRLRSNTGAGQPVALIMTRMATALAKIRPRRVLRAAREWESWIDCITKTEKAESEAQRGKPKGTLESESRNAIV